MRLILASGLTLFEVLISLLLLSLALLGLDAMELSALKLNRQAYYSALAEQQVHNLEERLRLQGAGEGVDLPIAAWNRENSLILPQGSGRVEGHYPEYTISLCWGGRQEEGGTCLSEAFIL